MILPKEMLQVENKDNNIFQDVDSQNKNKPLKYGRYGRRAYY